MISIIIITYNEEEYIECILLNILQQFKDEGDFEILVSDGGSSDKTIEIAKKYTEIINSSKSKAFQLNAGAKEAKGNILFFVHADMTLAKGTLKAISRQINEENFDGGGFANEFDKHNKKIKKLGNRLNLRIFSKKEQSDRNIFYGDNGIFVRKKVFEALGGFKEIPIMEDYDFSRRMKASYRVKLIKQPKIIVSARRHQKSGFITTRLQWIFIKKLYLIGVSPFRLARWYKDVR